LLIRRFKANRRKVLKATFLLSLFALFGVGGVVAATNISINSAAPLSLGAGYIASTACDNSITINTQNQFINNQFMVSTISLSDIDATYPNGCGQSVLDLSLIVNGALVNASFPIASSSTNDSYKFAGSAGYGYFANTVLTPFDIAQLSSVALSVQKVTPTYTAGRTGPAGGVVFYVSPTTFTSVGSACNTSCKYLEAAPSDTSRYFANTANQSTSVSGAKGTAIGTGFQNSVDIANQSGNTSTGSAAVYAREYRGGGFTDWYLPSVSELNQLCKWARGQAWVSDATLCNSSGSINSGLGASGFAAGSYWSSTDWFNIYAYYQSFNNGGQNYNSKDNGFAFRPIRAF
jgi:hypothetical protein